MAIFAYRMYLSPNTLPITILPLGVPLLRTNHSLHLQAMMASLAWTRTSAYAGLPQRCRD